MFGTLLETRRAVQRPARGAALSIAIHAAVIVLAAAATAQAGTRRPPPERPSTMIYTPVPPRNVTAVHRTGISAPRATMIVVAVPRVDVEVPTHLPPVSDPIGIAPPDAFASDPSPGTVTRPGTTEGAPGGVWSEHAVEKPVLALADSPRPRYPELLRSAGVEGEVIAQFVVDTLGRVEAGSVRVLRNTHALFAQAVERTLPLARFSPAEAAGHKVRQLVQQPFVFAVQK